MMNKISEMKAMFGPIKLVLNNLTQGQAKVWLLVSMIVTMGWLAFLIYFLAANIVSLTTAFTVWPLFWVFVILWLLFNQFRSNPN